MRHLKLIVCSLILFHLSLNAITAEANADTTPPATPVKLIFIHHSIGGNWLADPNPDGPYGGLGTALMNNNYYVSATSYGWGPYSVGDNTDIPNWPTWFTGANSSTILTALYAETGQNIGDFGSWPRLGSDPGGENKIVLIKPCYPNSDIFGNPTDPAEIPINDSFTVSNVKAVYNNLLSYFQTRTDKLFIVITAPPQNENEYTADYQTAAERSANTRAINNWLVNDWLDNYLLHNVAVFDYYNVLTAADNHHRWNNGAIEHITSSSNNYSAYPVDVWDSHPSTAGQLKATSEFINLLNYFYNRWQADQTNTQNSITILSDLSFTMPEATYQTITGNIILWAHFTFFGDQNGILLWELADYGTATSTGNLVMIAPDLSFSISDATYQPATGSELNLRVNFRFFDDQNGTLLWALDSFIVE